MEDPNISALWITGIVGISGVILGAILGFLLNLWRDKIQERGRQNRNKLRLEHELEGNLAIANIIMEGNYSFVPRLRLETTAFDDLHGRGGLDFIGEDSVLFHDLRILYIRISTENDSLNEFVQRDIEFFAMNIDHLEKERARTKISESFKEFESSAGLAKPIATDIFKILDKLKT